MKSYVVPLDGSLVLSVSISPCQFSCHLLQFFVLRVWRVRLSSVTDHESAVRDLSVRWHQHFKLSGFRTRVTLQQLPGGCERSIHWDLGGSAKSDNFYTINHFLTECKIYAPLHFQTLQAGDSFFFFLQLKSLQPLVGLGECITFGSWWVTQRLTLVALSKNRGDVS